MVGLGALPGSVLYSCAYAVSADGSTIVGFSESAIGIEPFLWDSADGMSSLREVLVNDLDLDLTGWDLGPAKDVSDDGLTIVGYGTNPSGEDEGWVAHIPEPATLWLLSFAAAAVLRYKRR